MSHYRSECSQCGEYHYLNDDALCGECADALGEMPDQLQAAHADATLTEVVAL